MVNFIVFVSCFQRRFQSLSEKHIITQSSDTHQLHCTLHYKQNIFIWHLQTNLIYVKQPFGDDFQRKVFLQFILGYGVFPFLSTSHVISKIPHVDFAIKIKAMCFTLKKNSVGNSIPFLVLLCTLNFQIIKFKVYIFIRFFTEKRTNVKNLYVHLPSCN